MDHERTFLDAEREDDRAPVRVLDPERAVLGGEPER
jgi:hypothetical protein